jgi:hypothetical protein
MVRARSATGCHFEVRLKGQRSPSRLDDAGIRRFDFELADPFRHPRPHVGQRSYSGRQWVATTGAHLWFESLLERTYLLEADWDVEVDRIAAQPLRISFPSGEGPRTHVPDFLVRRRDGTIELVNVRPASKVAADQLLFDAVVDLASALGWRSSVFTEPPIVRTRNLEWLAAYANPAADPDREHERLCAETFTSPTSLAWVYERHDPHLVTATFRGMWTHQLDFDVDTPIDDATIVQLRAA